MKRKLLILAGVACVSMFLGQVAHATDATAKKAAKNYYGNYSLYTSPSEMQKIQKFKETKKLEAFYKELSESSDMSKPSGISKELFIEVLENLPYDYEGFYERNAEVFWEESQRTGINEFLMVGITAIESGWGRYRANNNNFAGLTNGRGGYQSFETEEEFIIYLANLLSENYINSSGVYYRGTSLTCINKNYCERSEWATQVRSAINMIIESYLYAETKE